MPKAPSQLEWHVLDEHDEKRIRGEAQPWIELPPEEPPLQSRPYWRSYLASILILLLVVVGYTLWQRAEDSLQQIDTELHNVAQAEIWLAAQGDKTQVVELPDSPAVNDWHNQFLRENGALGVRPGNSARTLPAMSLEVTEIGGDWAVAEMTIDRAGATGTIYTYRQKRFYRQGADGWQRIAPPAEYWGTPGSLESSYFVFHFYERDAEDVVAIAPQADALYQTLRRNFGLPLDPQQAKMVVEISLAELPGTGLLRPWKAGLYRIPSPDLYLAPIQVSDQELLLQSLVLFLTADIAKEATVFYQMRWVRTPVLEALRLWALWDADLPLSAWRPVVAEWRLAAPLNADDYDNLCALHKVWLASPILLAIPLTCAKQEYSAIKGAVPTGLSVTQLEYLTANAIWYKSIELDNLFWVTQSSDTVILETLFEYVTNSYGREKLPALLAALGNHREWETLSPAVFGVPSAEFAAGWREYLVAHYALDNAQ